ncbi:hypothetical protein HZH68_004685 [Vespula germanica]|uniref:Uncharacterized protein n=1 Tax=Vespula germanica TaxID=30212 RepID=A0A834KLU2_VESGE|nr:hypothetical protein HZH68_004685 [Vespula germanica]
MEAFLYGGIAHVATLEKLKKQKKRRGSSSSSNSSSSSSSSSVVIVEVEVVVVVVVVVEVVIAAAVVAIVVVSKKAKVGEIRRAAGNVSRCAKLPGEWGVKAHPFEAQVSARNPSIPLMLRGQKSGQQHRLVSCTGIPFDSIFMKRFHGSRCGFRLELFKNERTLRSLYTEVSNSRKARIISSVVEASCMGYSTLLRKVLKGHLHFPGDPRGTVVAIVAVVAVVGAKAGGKDRKWMINVVGMALPYPKISKTHSTPSGETNARRDIGNYS